MKYHSIYICQRNAILCFFFICVECNYTGLQAVLYYNCTSFCVKVCVKESVFVSFVTIFHRLSSIALLIISQEQMVLDRRTDSTGHNHRTTLGLWISDSLTTRDWFILLLRPSSLFDQSLESFKTTIMFLTQSLLTKTAWNSHSFPIWFILHKQHRGQWNSDLAKSHCMSQ